MTFANEKKNYLAKVDRSKKGSIDEKIMSLVSVVNKSDRYYTTSSCSGRAILLRPGKKNETDWIRVSHHFVESEFLGRIGCVGDADLDGNIWLKVEPFIMHVACEDLSAAKRLLAVSKKMYKKSCILTVAKKFIIEIRGSENIVMPFSSGGKKLFTDNEFLVNIVNQKLSSIFDGIKKFEKLIETEL